MFKLIDICKTYKSGDVTNYALRDVTLDIAPGELVCLTGKSGSGKSTLLGILGLINVPSSGQILFEEKQVNGLDDKRLAQLRRQNIGIVFQQFNLHPALSALENVMYPLYLLKNKDAKELAMEALRDVGMQDFAHRKPKQLSGGQMQRVSIARAFVKTPKLIIADEPTANLDSENSIKIYELIERLNAEKGVTVVIATHDRAFFDTSVRGLTFQDGRIVH